MPVFCLQFVVGMVMGIVMGMVMRMVILLLQFVDLGIPTGVVGMLLRCARDLKERSFGEVPIRYSCN